MYVKAKNLSKKFGNRIVVNNINLEITPGKILGLLGPNGAGKSTTIKMLSGQIEPTSGEIELDGHGFKAIPNSLRGKIGVMPQEVIIWDYLTVKENLEFSAKTQGMTGTVLKNRVNYLIDSLNLEKELKTLGKNLSGGFKRRLNLAISIIHEPSLIFLDEPTPGIDPQNRRFLWDFIGTLRGSEKYSVVLTDHYLEEAEKLSDYVVIIDNGEIIAEGTVNELKHKYTEGSILKVDIADESMNNQKGLDLMIKALQKSYGNVKLAKDKLTISSNDLNKALRELLDLTHQNNIRTDNLTIKESSLEDVFMLLTGKEIRE